MNEGHVVCELENKNLTQEEIMGYILRDCGNQKEA